MGIKGTVVQPPAFGCEPRLCTPLRRGQVPSHVHHDQPAEVGQPKSRFALDARVNGHSLARLSGEDAATMRRHRRAAMRPGRPTRRGALLLYAAGWLLGVGLIVGLVLAIFGKGDDTVSLPPVRETELVDAAVHSRCELRTARTGERLNPPVDGPAGRPAAAPGFYDQPLSSAALAAAVRRGIIVIQFRADLDGRDVDALKSLQAAVPVGTIVAPNNTGMRFELAVTAYRRLLGCPRFSAQALDAVQLFRGRFLGSGPDSS
jgi:hypothetical protein